MGLFNAGWPWERDCLVGRRSRVPLVKIWAYTTCACFAVAFPFHCRSASFGTEYTHRQTERYGSWD